MSRITWIIVFLISLEPAVSISVAREWTAIDSGKAVDANFVRFESGRAVLRRCSDQQLYSVSLAAFSLRDRRYVRQQLPPNQRFVVTRQYPGYLSLYELPTPSDLYYARVVQRVNSYATTSLDQWPMFQQIKSEMGDVLAKVVDAEAVSSHVASTCSADHTESPLGPLREIVEDCARILDVAKPHIRIRNDRTPQAYVFGLDEPFLVINSGLLELFEDSPEELRFVIGHELGHLKCHHL